MATKIKDIFAIIICYFENLLLRRESKHGLIQRIYTDVKIQKTLFSCKYNKIINDDKVKEQLYFFTWIFPGLTRKF